MADEYETLPDDPEAVDVPALGMVGRSQRRRRMARWALASGAILALGVGYLWTSREEIAGNVIQSTLDDYGIKGTYRIESIGPRRQILTDIVIGDPARPDLTIERAELTITPAFGLPRISAVRLVRPRINGAWREGRVSFGALDRYLYESPSEEPVQLPDIDLELVDARARIATPFGAAGAAAGGSGNLASGFAGHLALAVPRIEGQGCKGQGAGLDGRLTTSQGRTRFAGPLRLARLACTGDAAFALENGEMGLSLEADKSFAMVAGTSQLRIGKGGASGASWQSLAGQIDVNWREAGLTGRYRLDGKAIAAPGISLARLGSGGSLRSRDAFASFEWQGDLEGTGLAPDVATKSALAGWRKAAAGTLGAPLIGRIEDVLRRESAQSRLSADFTMRRRAGQLSLVVPNASLRGSSGASLLALSRVQMASGDKPALSGNFTSGGGLPAISGRIEQARGKQIKARFAMPDYRVADARLALPELVVNRMPDGSLNFAGRLQASGAIPGGRADGLVVPLSGGWSAQSGLSLWRECVALGAQRIRTGGLDLARPGLRLCPAARGRAMVESTAGPVRIAARVAALDLAGRMGEQPLRIKGGAVAIEPGGRVSFRNLDIALGPMQEASRFALARLDMRLGRSIDGSFSGGAFGLYPVPLDLRDAQGKWRLADGRLELRDASFTVEDRKVDDRFQPLIARDARLDMVDGAISAEALLRNPESDREVVRVDLRHDLGSGAGDARLAVDNLRFDDKLQPDMLSRLMLGVIANASGSVEGEGQIAWDGQGVTSSGDFGTEALDFAAAFGPAQGVSGRVHFTDLVNLTTARDQVLLMRSMNPGIEVFDGKIIYDLDGGEVLTMRDARWPFLGGSLVMDPVALRIGVAETRRYVLHLSGVEAGQFIDRMEMGNLSASGAFDGTIPLVFDENGGRIEGGMLRSRAPGGNLSYVGELTYEDLTPMANFAFDTLRSLDYRQMQVALDGPLTGEIVTKVSFDGIRQGAGAKSNIVTRQIAKLPIRFNVNIHAPFYRLITSLKAMYDPAMVRDPRDLGLMDSKGRASVSPQLRPEALLPSSGGAKETKSESPVQHRESETIP